MYELRLLIEAFRSTTFYVLGAGASANIVPMTFQLKHEITHDQMQLGVYNVDPIPQDEFTQRIIGETSNEDFFLCRVSPDYVLAHAAHQLSKHHWQRIEYCPQYDVFYFAKKPSTIFTANLDGLAERHKHHHFVYHFHGIIPAYFGTPQFHAFIQDHFSFYDALSIELGNILLIQKEAAGIKFRIPYVLSKQSYMKSKYLLIIGYSFGKNEFGIDDSQTYSHLFEDLYSCKKIPILIISPDTYELKYRIQESVKSKNVYGLNMRWDFLSKGLISYFVNFNCHSNRGINHIREIHDHWMNKL